MNTIETIPLTNLAYILIPVLIVVIIIAAWKLHVSHSLYAITRMLIQLLAIGYFLNSIFATHSAQITLSILFFMLIFSSWIALGTVKKHRRLWFGKALFSLGLAAIITLSTIILGVLEVSPWYEARYIIPLGGMILANSMNSLSLAAERFQSEIKNNSDSLRARNISFNAALIPTINMLFAVGLVSLPGMMTGQILSGISPFIAARYQIMVMCMMFASSGISAACFLALVRRNYKT